MLIIFLLRECHLAAVIIVVILLWMYSGMLVLISAEFSPEYYSA
jgi:hypothetical protein